MIVAADHTQNSLCSTYPEISWECVLFLKIVQTVYRPFRQKWKSIGSFMFLHVVLHKTMKKTISLDKSDHFTINSLAFLHVVLPWASSEHLETEHHSVAQGSWENHDGALLSRLSSGRWRKKWCGWSRWLGAGALHLRTPGLVCFLNSKQDELSMAIDNQTNEPRSHGYSWVLLLTVVCKKPTTTTTSRTRTRTGTGRTATRQQEREQRERPEQWQRQRAV